MARIVLISPYLKGGQNAAKLMHRTRYVATRPGVELLAQLRQKRVALGHKPDDHELEQQQGYSMQMHM